MQCLKCGNKVNIPNVFCDACLDDMATCPVRSDAVIHIPERPMPVTEKKSRKKQRTGADYIRSLRRLILWLCLMIVVLTATVCMLTYQLFELDRQASAATPLPPGMNYSTESVE